MDKVLFNALITYFKAKKIKVPYNELKLQLFSHPHTPSLYAVSETLNFLKIENIAAQIEPSQLNQLPEHFIAFIDDEKKGQYFSHVQQKNENQVYLHGDKKLISKENFNKIWTGIVLLAEQGHNPTISEGLWFNWIVISLIVLITIILWPSIPSLIFCIIGIFGLYVSNEIFETTNDRSSYLGQKICGQEEESGCNKILKTSDYHITLFSLNNLFFSFLLSTIILTILNVGFSSVHIFIYSIAIITVISTIVIQGFILKTWCRLCLLSSSIVLSQTLVIVFSSSLMEPLLVSDSIFIFLKYLFIYGLLFIVTLLGIYNYRKIKTLNYKLSASEIDLLRFKRSSKTIRKALADTRNIEHIEGADQLIFGNPKANQIIRLVLSTSCSFCKKAFEKLYNHSLDNSSEYRFQLILNHYGTSSSKRNFVAAAMINFYRNKKPDEFLKMMNRWFQHRDVGKYLTENTINVEDEDYHILFEQRNWCEKNNLFQTPILIINDKIIPDYYDATFLEDILEVMKEKE